jgi:hypothetical protein
VDAGVWHEDSVHATLRGGRSSPTAQEYRKLIRLGIELGVNKSVNIS